MEDDEFFVEDFDDYDLDDDDDFDDSDDYWGYMYEGYLEDDEDYFLT
jgi:hypothetical protein